VVGQDNHRIKSVRDNYPYEFQEIIKVVKVPSLIFGTLKPVNIYRLISSALCAVPLVLLGQTPPVQPNPLERHYRAGEVLVYEMKAVNEGRHYRIRAEGVVGQDASGALAELFTWKQMEIDGNPYALKPTMDSFRQVLTLAPEHPPMMPDLTKVDPWAIGPITDLMTFYVDLWLANKLQQLHKSGDHFYFHSPMPASSWADGSRVLLGESAVDFDFTVKEVDEVNRTALLEVKHVPPAQLAVHIKAEWMKKPVASLPNNWVTVSKTAGGYEAGVGQETFDVLIKISTIDGKILHASMNNPVHTEIRSCEDEALTKCGMPQPHDILRQVEITLLP
jgi:hypothetical protein